MQEAKRLCTAVMAELKKERIPFDSELELGVMIETPAAVMIAPELAKEVSFFSIGTNDLAQYTIAVDRQSIQGLERFYDPKHPAVLRMIKMTADAAHEAGIWAGICGELAADCTLTQNGHRRAFCFPTVCSSDTQCRAKFICGHMMKL